MDRYWRIGHAFTAFKYVSKMMPDMFIVGLIVKGKDGRERLASLWEEFKELIPEDYFHGYDLLQVELSYGHNYIVFDTYEQGSRFVDFVESNFNCGVLAYAAMFKDGIFVCEST